jgi:hypothetical protein
MRNNKNRDMASDILKVVREGTKKWTNTRKAEERSPASRVHRMSRLTRQRTIPIKDAAWQIMERAYLQASGNGTLPANARQIMYAARPHIQQATGQALQSNYFTQVLLPDYLQETGAAWDVVYDDRGHFIEPHTEHTIGLGTLAVRHYLANIKSPSLVDAGIAAAKVETRGPSGNFGAVLFIEKEGFTPILEAAQIAEKFDAAIMSTKGMSVTAARHLADEMCAKYDIPLLVLHDFDKSGFAIAGTLQRDTRRYEFQNNITVIDVGLSLADVQAMRLQHEYQHHPKGRRDVLEANLRLNGATDQEIAFMFADFHQLQSTRRVELNAMTSPQFVTFVERKLRQHGIAKIVPDKELLAEAYARMERGRRLEEAVESLKEIDTRDVEPPEDLEDRVRVMLKAQPSKRWDAVLEEIVASDIEIATDCSPQKADREDLCE